MWNNVKKVCVIYIVPVLIFIAAAFNFFFFLYGICDIIGSIICGSFNVAGRDLMRSLPLFLNVVSLILLLYLYHYLTHGESIEHSKKKIFEYAIALIAVSAIIIIWVIYGCASGVYLSIAEGSPSWIYPLDIFLGNIVFLAIGICTIIFKGKLKESQYHVTEKKINGGFATATCVWLCCALYAFAAWCYSFGSLDFGSEYTAYSIGQMILFFVAWALLFVYEIVFKVVKPEYKKKVLFPTGIACFAVGIFAIVYYFASLAGNLDAPSNGGFGLLSIDFTASVNAINLIYFLAILIPSIVILVQAIRIKVKKED